MKLYIKDSIAIAIWAVLALLLNVLHFQHSELIQIFSMYNELKKYSPGTSYDVASPSEPLSLIEWYSMHSEFIKCTLYTVI